MLNGLFIVSTVSTVVELIAEKLEPTVTYVPQEKDLAHKDKDGKVIIGNSQLYYDDMNKYPPLQIKKWIKEGRYNLTSEELKKEEERIAEKYKKLYGY